MFNIGISNNLSLSSLGGHNAVIMVCELRLFTPLTYYFDVRFCLVTFVLIFGAAGPSPQLVGVSVCLSYPGAWHFHK